MIRRTAITLTLANRQRRDPVPLAWLSRLARAAVRRLRIRARGTFSIVFVEAAQMRRLNARFTGRRGLTDVLSFRFDGEPIVGEILVAPAAVRHPAHDRPEGVRRCHAQARHRLRDRARGNGKNLFGHGDGR